MPEDASLGEVLSAWYGRTRGGAARDPARMRALLAALELRACAPVVTVTGTNGKGSVAARIAAGATAAGLRPLRFLSPHVERFHERIEVAGAPVANSELLRFAHHLDASERTADLPPAAFFEATLALALQVAHERSAGLLVLEAGVGAARDATAAVPADAAVVVTSVGADHLDVIGPTVRDAARDKADAIRSGVPVVSGVTGPAAAVVARVARERGAPLYEARLGSEVFSLAGLPAAPRRGVARRAARLAVATLRALTSPIAGRPAVLPADRLAAAIAAAVLDPGLPARRERFALLGGRTVLLDGAHNPPALRELAREAPASARLLFGIAARKRPWEALAVLPPAWREGAVLTAAVAGERPFGDDPRFVPDPERALAEALVRTPAGGTLVIAGSFWLAGTLRPLLRRAVSQADRAPESSARTPARPALRARRPAG